MFCQMQVTSDKIIVLSKIILLSGDCSFGQPTTCDIQVWHTLNIPMVFHFDNNGNYFCSFNITNKGSLIFVKSCECEGRFFYCTVCIAFTCSPSAIGMASPTSLWWLLDFHSNIFLFLFVIKLFFFFFFFFPWMYESEVIIRCKYIRVS